MSLRAWPRHADVDHGRHRARRAAGILIKDAEALERFAKVDKLVVDKTGTLTEGKPKVTTLVPAGGVEEDELLRLAASLERASEHPLAGAIVATARERGLEILDAVDFDHRQGVRGRVDGREVAIGNQSLLESLQIDPGPLAERTERQRAGWPGGAKRSSVVARTPSSSEQGALGARNALKHGMWAQKYVVPPDEDAVGFAAL